MDLQLDYNVKSHKRTKYKLHQIRSIQKSSFLYTRVFSVGSDVISTCTYQASVVGFMEHLKISQQESYNLIKESVTLVRKAWEQYKRLHPETSKIKNLPRALMEMFLL